MKRFVLVLFSLPMLFLCEPLDRYHPEQYDFLNPSITVNLSQSDFWDGDTVSADTVRLTVIGNELSRQPSYFRRLLDEGEWSDWVNDDEMSYRIELTELSEGEHTLTIEVCYDPQGMIVDSTITFYRAVKPDVTITGNADPSFEVGSPCTLRVTAAGTGNLGFAWYHDSTLIESATEDSLIIPSVTSADAGVYHCVVTNAWGEEKSPDMHLQVLYRIIYHGNENTGGEAPVDTNVYDSEVIARILENSGELTRRGYTFGGWKSTPDGSGDSPDSVIGFETATENVTLYAWWIPNSAHIVRFDANGATWEEVTDTALQFRTGELMVIPDNGSRLVNPGATFTGWNTMPDGSGTQYTDSDELEMLDEDITLYAQWTQVTATHSVTYNSNGAEIGEVPVDTRQYRTGDTVTVLGNSGNLEKEGNTFIGWNSAEQGDTGNAFAPDATFVMGTEDVILYARWTTEPLCSLTYHGNGSDGGDIPEVTYHTRNTLVTVADQGTLSRVGYSFDGWSTNADHTLGEDVPAGASFTIPDHNVTLFARWTVNRYTITYNGIGSTGGSVPDQVTADYHTSVTIAGGGTMERAGYTFDGWNTASDGTGTGYSAGTTIQMGAENIELFAQWTPGLFTVTFEKNHEDATGEMAPQTIACDATDRLSSSGFERLGFAFVGWSLQQEGEIAYTNGAEYTMGPGNVTLYAKWADDFRTVTFVKNDDDATGEMAPQNIPSNTTLLLSANAFEKYGWTFAGWSLTADGDVAYGDEAPFAMGTENVTLYAKWQKETMLIAFAASVGSGNEAVASPEPAITVTVNRTPGSGDTYSVNYTVSGTASAGPDYTLDNGTLSFDAATTSRIIPLGIIDDALAESDETVIITLSDPSQDAALGERNTCTYTIVDNDLAAVTFQSSAGSGPESSVNQTIVVLLSPALPDGQTGSVDYAVTGGTATGSGIDYTLAGGTLYFNSSISSLTIPLEVVNDVLNEANETVVITLSNPVNLRIGTNATYSYTITDNDPPVITFTSSGGSGSESSVSPSPAITVRASPTPRSGQTFSVSYTVSGSSTATGGSDYTLTGNTLNFNASTTARTLPLSIINDNIAETGETVVITLSSPTGGAVLGTQTTFTYTINDDETPAIWFENASGSGVESEQDPSAAITVTVNPAPPAGSTISVDFTLSNSSTATGGGIDYALSGGSLTFTSTTTTRTIPLLISSDNEAEADETVVITLENPTGGAALGTPSEFTYTIIDDDRTVFIASVTGSPSESGPESQTESNFIISVVPPPEDGQSYTVDYAVGGTATGGGTDYTLTNGTLSFDAANPLRTVQFTVNNDGTAEADETIVISLSNPSQGVTPGNQDTYTYTIVDNDRTVAFTSSAGSESESVSSPAITVAVSQELSGGQTGSVQYAVTGGTATGGSDYTLTGGTLNFDASNSTGTVPLAINNDALNEANETVIITLSNPVNVTLGANATYTYTISDNDPVAITFSTSAGSGSESVSPPSPAITVTASPTPRSGQTFSVSYTVSGTATGSGIDYTLANGTLSFNASNISRTLPLTIVNDAIAETNETVVITLSSPTNGAVLGTRTTFTYTIVDNETAVVSFSGQAGSGLESVSPSPAITITCSPAPGSGLTPAVNYTVTGTATGGGNDYTLTSSGTISFTETSTAFTIPLTITDDASFESDETVIITLSNPSGCELGSNTQYTYTIINDDIGTVAYVDRNAKGLFTGASWEHAFRYLQDALAKATQPGSIIEEIHVAQGTYYPDETYANPDGTDERISTFALIDGVNLLGGYPPGGGTRNSDPLTNETWLNGNIDHEDGNNDLDGNAYHVVTGANCIIDGFTISGGNADYYQTEDQGGGLLVNVYITQTVNNCRFLANSAYDGDGACIRGGTATFTDCIFEMNSSVNSYEGTALFIGNYWDEVEIQGNATVTGSRFINNSIGGGIFFEGNLLTIDGAVFEGNSGYSGAIHSTGTTIVLTNSIFTNNASTEGGSVRLMDGTAQSTITGCTFSTTPGSSGGNGIDFDGCGGINRVTGTAFNSLSGYAMNISYSGRGNGGPVSIDNCTFDGNRGGALSTLSSAVTVTKCDFTNNSIDNYNGGAVRISGQNSRSSFDKCTFLSNTASYGGALCYTNCTGINSVTNSVFLENSSTRGGAVYLYWAAPSNYTGDPVQLVNCTFSENSSGSDGGGAIYFGVESRLDVVNSILWNNTGADYPDIYYDPATIPPQVSYCDIQQGGFAGTNNNISINPEFCNSQPSLPTHLKLEAPNGCSNGATIEFAPPDDIEGRLRGNQPSMGAYQYHSDFPCQ